MTVKALRKMITKVLKLKEKAPGGINLAMEGFALLEASPVADLIRDGEIIDISPREATPRAVKSRKEVPPLSKDLEKGK
jgi:hypothetical protein